MARGHGIIITAAAIVAFLLMSPGVWAQPAPAAAPAMIAETVVKSLGNVEKAVGEPVFSPNGERVAYNVRKDNGNVAVVSDGKESREYKSSVLSSGAFSADGRRFAFRMQKTDNAEGIVADGVEYVPGWLCAFSPDGRQMAYSNTDGIVRNGRLEIGLNIRGKKLVFSPDSRHLAYVHGYPARIVVDGKAGPAFAKPDILGDPVWAPDSGSLAHTASQGDKAGDRWVLFWKDKKVGGPYDMVEGIAFSPDSKRIAWRALVKDQWAVVVNGKKGPDYSTLGGIVFSADGKHMAYPACGKDGWSVVLDSKEGPACLQVLDPVVFSPDGKHVAYRALRDGKAVVVCDDRQTPPYDQISWAAFNGNHLAFAATRGKDSFIVCDGLEGPPHERVVVPERACDTPFKVRYVAIDKNEASLIEIATPADRTWESQFVPPPAPAAK